MENPSYKNEDIERKYLNNMRKNKFLKVMNSLLKLEKDFIELKDREVQIKREIEELFFKPIILSKDDMYRFEQKEMKKTRPIKNTWYDWLINYIPESIRESAGGFKDKIASQTHLKNCLCKGKKLRKPKIQNIRNPFILKKKK